MNNLFPGRYVTARHGAESRHTSRNHGVALICLAAGLSLIASVYLFLTGSKEQGVFIGLWVPSILSLGNLLLDRGRHE